MQNSDADFVAAQHGYVNLGELESLEGYHLFEELPQRKREVRKATFSIFFFLLFALIFPLQAYEHLSTNSNITWWKEQHSHKLDKRKFPGMLRQKKHFREFFFFFFFAVLRALSSSTTIHFY